ncbi:MAG: NahK/ErcS family hybrid sensor histidine kinase/response regulator [Labrys sp. (in: a-proteobacteria)]
MQGWVVIVAALLYLAALFAVASYGDRMRLGWVRGAGRPYIYALSLGVYCTSWTFFGSVGLASRSGLDFLTIYIGPILMMIVCYPLILKVVRIAKEQNITSIADFVAARYGKSQSVAAIVTLAAVIGAIPYIALQLKAVAASLKTILVAMTLAPGLGDTVPVFGDLAFLVALFLAVFAIAFGTRHIDATEHQEGLMLAIAMESVVKLAAFITVGIYVTYVMFDGVGDLAARTQALTGSSLIERTGDAGSWVTMIALSFVCAILLPRQFHVTVVENTSRTELARAAWLFPLYLVLINLFVVPIAMAGLVALPAGSVDADMVVLALPLAEGAHMIALIAFIGGLSAATAMVIVECVAIAIMISNDIAAPILLRRQGATGANLGSQVLLVRRLSIFVILLLAYIYYRAAGDAALASIGLLAFAAIAQFAPAFFGGLLWKRATARGAVAGLLLGLGGWAYTLMLPNLVDSGVIGHAIIQSGPFGIEALRPTALFGLDLSRLVHGVVWSLGLNVLGFVLVSLAFEPRPIERVQANVFVTPDGGAPVGGFSLWRSAVTAGDVYQALLRYLGEERTARAFEDFARERGIPHDPKAEADIHLMRFAERLLASAIGAASSRLALSLMMRKRNVSSKAALQLLDDASAAIQYSRTILQTALDNARQGVSVFDSSLRLQAWNRAFRDIWDLPPDLARVGVGLEEIVRFNAERGFYGPGDNTELAAERLRRYVAKDEIFQTRVYPSGIVVETRTNLLPDGGIVTTHTDITDRVEAAEALEQANERLEQRVRERTEELVKLNEALGAAKAAADEANLSKTRFLAAASHDILQPLNAARLYATTLREKTDGGELSMLAGHVDMSLDAVEDILSTLLDISRIDAGALKPELSAFRIDDILSQLHVEFGPLAREKGLDLRFVPSSLTVRSDRRLLRRLLQNLVSNAIKYTLKGRVLIGVRRRGAHLVIGVFDTGLGIPKSKQKTVFREFQRLDQGAKIARGLGLGLSIVERLARLLGHRLDLASEPGRGTMFSIEVPIAPAAPPTVPHPVEPAATMPLDGLRILAIDNEPRILDGMAALLEGWGASVMRAADGAQALAAAEASRPDVVLADYHLDETDGLAVIEALRARLGADLPAVLITADRSPAVRAAAQAVSVPILAKPIKPAHLRAHLTRIASMREMV